LISKIEDKASKIRKTEREGERERDIGVYRKPKRKRCFFQSV
jgi:hypothetical protein